jgi:predicted transcriptional regulator
MVLQTLRVRDYMTRTLISVQPDMEILQALQIFVNKKIAGAPVVDASGKLIGILTAKDCLRVAVNASYHSEYGGVVADFMADNVASISPEDGILDVAKRFLADSYHRYPVLENGVLVGILSRRDMLRALGEAWQ